MKKLDWSMIGTTKQHVYVATCKGISGMRLVSTDKKDWYRASIHYFDKDIGIDPSITFHEDEVVLKDMEEMEMTLTWMSQWDR